MRLWRGRGWRGMEGEGSALGQARCASGEGKQWDGSVARAMREAGTKVNGN